MSKRKKVWLSLREASEMLTSVINDMDTLKKTVIKNIADSNIIINRAKAKGYDGLVEFKFNDQYELISVRKTLL